jgi:hypothetical protein
MSLKPALLHFKFENFTHLGSSPVQHSASVDLGSGGRKSFTLFLYPRSNDLRLSLEGATTPFDGKCSMMIRNSVGDVVVKRDFDKSYIVRSFMKRSDIVDDGNNILVGGF